MLHGTGDEPLQIRQSVRVSEDGSDAASDLVSSALESLWSKFDTAVESGDFSPLTPGQCGVLFAWVMSGLVDNGGWTSWIESLGHRSNDAATALEHIGAGVFVPLLEDASRLYPTASAHAPEERLSASEAWGTAEEQQLDRLDSQFYAVSVDTDLVQHYAARYVVNHPEEFPHS